MKDPAKTNITAASGYEGPKRLDVVGPYDWNASVTLREVGLRGLTIEENSNRPCYATTHFGQLLGAAALDYPTPQQQTGGPSMYTAPSFQPSVRADYALGTQPLTFVRRSYTGCKNNATTPHVAAWVSKTMPAQARSVRLGSDSFVHGVQVCTSDENQTSKRRLKGVRLFAAKLDGSSGHVQPQPTSTQGDAHYQLPNCDVWRPKVSCAADRLATGLVYHVNPDGEIFGLALQCSGLKEG